LTASQSLVKPALRIGITPAGIGGHFLLFEIKCEKKYRSISSKEDAGTEAVESDMFGRQ